MKKPITEMGDIIRQIRITQGNEDGKKKCGISQKALSKKAGVGINLVTLYELGELKPWAKLEMILDALGYDLEVIKR